jgi:ketosteroid isomerase-like protein
MGECRELADRFYAGFNAGDHDGLAKIFDPDVVTVEPGGGTMHGFDAFRAFGETFRRAAPDARLNLRSAVEGDTRIAIEGSFTGTHTGPLATPQGDVPPTGRAIDLPYADFLEIRAGRIVAHHTYYDQLAFLGMLGLLPAPTPA